MAEYTHKLRTDTPVAAAKAEAVKEEKPKVELREQNLPLWDRKIKIMEERGTTPNDLFDTDPQHIECPDVVKENVSFWWASDIILTRRPWLPGFNYELYEPVTETEIKEWGLKLNTKDRTPEGIPRIGSDMYLYWAPKKLRDQQMKLMRGPSLQERMQKQAHELRERMAKDKLGQAGDGTGPLGSELVISNDPRDLMDRIPSMANVGTPY